MLKKTMCLIMNRLFGKQEKNMDSELTVIWSKRAKDTYFMVLDYLIENWSEAGGSSIHKPCGIGHKNRWKKSTNVSSIIALQKHSKSPD